MWAPLPPLLSSLLTEGGVQGVLALSELLLLQPQDGLKEGGGEESERGRPRGRADPTPPPPTPPHPTRTRLVDVPIVVMVPPNTVAKLKGGRGGGRPEARRAVAASLRSPPSSYLSGISSCFAGTPLRRAQPRTRGMSRATMGVLLRKALRREEKRGGAGLARARTRFDRPPFHLPPLTLPIRTWPPARAA